MPIAAAAAADAKTVREALQEEVLDTKGGGVRYTRSDIRYDVQAKRLELRAGSAAKALIDLGCSRCATSGARPPPHKADYGGYFRGISRNYATVRPFSSIGLSWRVSAVCAAERTSASAAGLHWVSQSGAYLRRTGVRGGGASP